MLYLLFFLFDFMVFMHFYFSGGKTNAPTVWDNQEFDTILAQLYDKRTIKAILIGFNMDHLEPFHVRSAGILDPRLAPWSGPELRFGTHVSLSILFCVEIY